MRSWRNLNAPGNRHDRASVPKAARGAPFDPRPRPNASRSCRHARKSAIAPKERRVIVFGPQPGEAADTEETHQAPHRAPTALERFAAAHKPPLGQHLIDAGDRYAEIVRAYKIAKGLDVIGGTSNEGRAASMTPEEIEAARELAVMRKRDCDAILYRIMIGLPSRMEALTLDNRDPAPNGNAKIIDGLMALAKHLGFAPRSRMRDD